MVAMGVVGDKEQMGSECSGIVRQTGSEVHNVRPGDRVATIGISCLRTQIVTTAEKVWKIPTSLSLEDAATMPIVYATAIYSLVHIGSLKQGQVCFTQ